MSNGSAEVLTISGDGCEDQGLVNPEHLPRTLAIDMVRLGSGCYADCLSCGAYEGMDVAGKRIQTITPDQLRENLLQEVDDHRLGVRTRLVDLFASVVTSGVDMEPLDSDIFNQAAKIICDLSGGKSKMVAISHGVGMYENNREGEGQYGIYKGQLERLRQLNDLLMSDVVPLFVLSMDSARSGGLLGQTAKKYHEKICEMEKRDSDFMKLIGGLATQDQIEDRVPKFGENETQWTARLAKIRNQQVRVVRERVLKKESLDENEGLIRKYIEARDGRRKAVIETNARGYAQTLNILLPAIAAGKRVTISLQGDDKKDSLAYHGLAREIWQRTLEVLTEIYKLSNTEVQELQRRVEVTPPRIYAPVGRAKNLLGVSEPVDECPVIPDPTFVRRLMSDHAPKVTRGMLQPDGSLMVQSHRPRHSYPDTVAPSVENQWAKVALQTNVVTAGGGKVVALPLRDSSLGRGELLEREG